MRLNKMSRRAFVLTGAGTLLLGFAAGVASKFAIGPAWKNKYQVDWGDSVGRKVSDIPYGDGEANKLDLYLPADASRKSYGLVVYLHAGGFTSGDKADDASMLQWLCSKGYVACGINYTLFGDEHPEASVRSQSLEVRDAVPIAVERASELGYTIDQMAVAGGSAGGCLALIYAYRDGATAPVPLRMVFEAVGPASMNREDWTNYGLDKDAGAAAGLLGTMAGVPLTAEEVESGEYLEKVRDVSAVDWVGPESVPTVMAYGEKDKVAPFLSSVRLDAALTDAGVDHEYIVLPHSGHGLQNDDDLFGQYMEAVEKYLGTYLPVG